MYSGRYKFWVLIFSYKRSFIERKVSSIEIAMNEFQLAVVSNFLRQCLALEKTSVPDYLVLPLWIKLLDGKGIFPYKFSSCCFLF